MLSFNRRRIFLRFFVLIILVLCLGFFWNNNNQATTSQQLEPCPTDYPVDCGKYCCRAGAKCCSTGCCKKPEKPVNRCAECEVKRLRDYAGCDKKPTLQEQNRCVDEANKAWQSCKDQYCK